MPLHFVVILLLVIWLIPTIGLFINSFRPSADVQATGWWTAIFQPSQLTLSNYTYVLNSAGIWPAFINSLFITIPATVIPIFVAAFAAYAFSWMSFPGRNVLFVAVVGLLVVPLQTTFIPILQLFGVFHLNGQFLALWLAHTGYGLPFAIYLLRNFMGSLPREVFESASIDGASHVTSFLRLALPMTVPAIAALAIFQFLFVWNDLLVALIYLGAANPAERAADDRRRQPGQLAGQWLVVPGGGGLPVDWRCPWWCSSPSSATSCAASSEARSRAEPSRLTRCEPGPASSAAQARSRSSRRRT